MSLREIVDRVPLCLPDGRLNPEAIGYTRRPLHEPNLRGWGRNKRWEYWGLISPTHLLGVTIASLDYAGLAHVYLLDRRDGSHFSEERVLPFARGVRLEDAIEPERAEVGGGLKIAFTKEPDGIRLRVKGARVELDAIARSRGDALGVVVPWSETRFQYTIKDVARSLEGTLRVDGEAIDLRPDESSAILDRGRGRWPREIMWNWGAGFGVVGGRAIGLQLGGKWTDGTGSTENAIIVDGRLEHLGEEVRWEYERENADGLWRVRSERVDATLRPFHLRREATNLLLIRSSIYQAVGVWSGSVRLRSGEEVALGGLVGWAEEAAHLW